MGKEIVKAIVSWGTTELMDKLEKFVTHCFDFYCPSDMDNYPLTVVRIDTSKCAYNALLRRLIYCY